MTQTTLPDDVVRVMSFNVRAAFSWDGINCWPLRRGMVARVVTRQKLTIGAFQEVMWPARRLLAAQLTHCTGVGGPPSGSPVLHVRNPIFVSRQALDIVGAGGFWLSTMPDRWSRSWGARHVRSASWLALSSRGRQFLVMNLHLDHRAEAARQGAVDLVLARLDELGWPGRPAVLCGDFNCDAGGAVHSRLLAAGFRDTFVDAGLVDDESAFTSHHFQGRRIGHDRRIDWILCSPPLRTLSATIVRDAAPPRYPSDHYPVVAELEWRN